MNVMGDNDKVQTKAWISQELPAIPRSQERDVEQILSDPPERTNPASTLISDFLFSRTMKESIADALGHPVGCNLLWQPQSINAVAPANLVRLLNLNFLICKAGVLVYSLEAL